jgi:hypothetical protein
MLSPDGSQPNGLAVVNVDPTSERYGQIVHQVIMPNTGGEFHYFGWKACYSACVTFLVFAYDRFWFSRLRVKEAIQISTIDARCADGRDFAVISYRGSVLPARQDAGDKWLCN